MAKASESEITKALVAQSRVRTGSFNLCKRTARALREEARTAESARSVEQVGLVQCDRFLPASGAFAGIAPSTLLTTASSLCVRVSDGTFVPAAA